ncbi:MAG: 5'-nucleotidase C-terminal domain-containing protein [Deltaproteobacteria bacterium]|nr:5'-nucleotidase C-terminal domain-containing protein [Deltaproteobacteria bacterium]
MKKLRLLSVSIIAVFMMAGCCGLCAYTPSPVENSLVILHTNDHHGHPLAFSDNACPEQGGLPARATLVNDVRGEFQNVLVLDAGDLNTGRPESNFFKAKPDIQGYNYIKYDAMAIGNHEFDLNMAGMQAQIQASEFPWLCANAKKNGQYLDNVKPYIIKDYKEFKVAVLGLVSSYTAVSGNPENITGITFEDEVKVALELVPELKKKADIVIALVHMGIFEDGSAGSKKLAAKVPGIALIIDGHSHTELEKPVMIKNEITGKDVAIVQAKCWGLYMGRALIRFANGEVTDLDWTPIPVNVKTREKKEGKDVFHFVGKEIKEDPVLLAALKPYQEEVESILSDVIGLADEPFLYEMSRDQETALGDIVADSQLWYMKKMGFDIDFAFQNGGGIRATLGSGEIKKKAIHEILPFDNSICVVSLKGSDVISLFSKAAGNVGKGAMPQVSEGVAFTIDKASGSVDNLLIGRQPVDPLKTYKIALNSYLAAGGDGYDVFKKRVEFHDSSMMQREVFIEYVISLGGKIAPKTYNRITMK